LTFVIYGRASLKQIQSRLEKRQPTIMHSFTIARKLMAVVGLLGLGCGVAKAETSRLAYLPTTFKAEGQAIRTTACLQVIERVYRQSAWWEDVSGNADPPERAFKAVISAIQRKDRAALLKLSDPTQGRDTKNFDEQSGAFFQQFGVIKLVAVPRAYEFDGLAVFFAKFQSGEQTAFVPFSFAYEEDRSFGFLPSRTKELTYQLVEDWFQTKWGPSATDNLTYCTDKDIKRATHRISLGSSSGSAKQAGHPSQLFLTGASLDTPGELAGLAAQVKSTIEKMKFALASKGSDDLVQRLTPEAGNRLKQWLASATETDRSRYKASITQETGQPFFFFDASPLVVLYTRSPDGGIHAMYFTFNAGNELLWTNSSYLTVSDKVFKTGPLRDAALLGKPFSSIAMKPLP
jgi:hypothetical protein